jgi:Dolichyl-phosphate-mannose-protein mannosyltransferase
LKSSRSWETLFSAVCLFVGIIAVTLRIRAAFNDLWMDEIWSIELVRELHSALGVFTQTHHDNNHYLNSLFIYFFGQRGNWLGYRIPSIIAGVGAVVLAWFIGRRQDKATAFFSITLTGFSYVMILYSSEARGYAPLIFFCYLCFLILQSFLERPRWKAACLFSIGAVLGFTAHLTFLIFCSASLIWLCTRLVRRSFPPSQIFKWIAVCYAAPLLYLLALYFVDIRHMQIGGGTPISVLNGYRATLAWTLGGPNLPWLQMITATICGLGLMVGLTILIRQRNDESVFFVAATVVIPLALPFFEHGTLHYVRYFIVMLGFLLLLFGRVLGWLFQSGRAGKIACGLLCSLFVALNAWDVGSLLKYGRGHIAEAIQFMDQTAKQQPVSFGGEQDFRIEFVLGFYWREMMGDKPASYYDHDHWPAEGPEWVIFHKESFALPVPPGKRFTDKFGNWYELVRTFPTAPLSGVHWFIYRKIPPPASS